MSKSKNRIILGIDPGLAMTGYGIIEARSSAVRCIAYGCIKTKAGVPFGSRLSDIYNEIGKIIKEYKPGIIALERIFFAKNMKTATMVGQAQGVIYLAGHLLGIPIREFTPLAVKLTMTGFGKAKKNQVQKMVRRIMHLREIPRPDDAADALAVAYCCSRTKF